MNKYFLVHEWGSVSNILDYIETNYGIDVNLYRYAQRINRDAYYISVDKYGLCWNYRDSIGEYHPCAKKVPPPINRTTLKDLLLLIK